MGKPLRLRLLLYSGSPNLDQSVFDVTGDFSRKDWPDIHGLGDRLLPSLQQTIHSTSIARVHNKIRVHERVV